MSSSLTLSSVGKGLGWGGGGGREKQGEQVAASGALPLMNHVSPPAASAGRSVTTSETASGISPSVAGSGGPRGDQAPATPGHQQQVCWSPSPLSSWGQAAVLNGSPTSHNSAGSPPGREQACLQHQLFSPPDADVTDK